MTDTPTEPVISSAKPTSNLFSKTNMALALAAGAFVLAAAPYVVPQVQSLIVRGGVLSGPKVLEDGYEALQAHNEAEAAKAFETAYKANESVLIHPEDPILGNPNAPITIVEFQDYLCGYCRRIAPQLATFLKENPDVRIVVKEYPVITQNSRLLAALALATRDSGKYEAVHNAIYAVDLKSDEDVNALLTSVGLNPAEIIAKSQSAEVQGHIDETLKMGNSLGLTGTPAFIIDGVLVGGADMKQIETLVATQRSKAKG